MAEIKSAFRQLAKLYHPDKNPAGVEHFTKILKAYETLSDPVAKASYDYKLQYNWSQAQQQQQRAKTTTKNWKFDERELKRRQYYNEHIKKYAKQTEKFMEEAETKSNYNEFKYILFATPLAVFLFLLIMHFATHSHDEYQKENNIQGTEFKESKGAEQKRRNSLKPGDAPYNAVFGTPYYDTIQNRGVQIMNLSGRELVVCLFDKERFVRCFYIPESTSAEVSQLPAAALDIYYMSGKNFDYSRLLEKVQVYGAFQEEQTFYKSQEATLLNKNTALSILAGDNAGFEKVGPEDFFKYAKKEI